MIARPPGRHTAPRPLPPRACAARATDELAAQARCKRPDSRRVPVQARRASRPARAVVVGWVEAAWVTGGANRASRAARAVVTGWARGGVGDWRCKGGPG